MRCIVHLPNDWNLKDAVTVGHIIQCIKGAMSTKVGVYFSGVSLMDWPNMDYQSILEKHNLRTVQVTLTIDTPKHIEHNEVAIVIIHPFDEPKHPAIGETFNRINNTVCPKSRGHIDKIVTKVTIKEDDKHYLVGLYRYPYSVYPEIWQTVGSMQNSELKKKLQDSFSMHPGKK